MWFTNQSPDDDYYYEKDVINYLVENPLTFKLVINRKKLNNHDTLMSVYRALGKEPGSGYLDPKEIKDYAIENDKYEWLMIKGDRGSDSRERVVKKYVDKLKEYADYGADSKEELQEEIDMLIMMASEEKDADLKKELMSEANKMRTQL